MSENNIEAYQQQINELNEQITFLKKENARLEDTVSWMHKLIWDLYKRLGISLK